MTKDEYSELLLDERWIEKKKQILSRDQHRCKVCGQDALPLHVHHLVYRKDAKPWEYPGSDLISLCDRCHFEQHTIRGIELGPRRPKHVSEVMINLIKEMQTNHGHGKK